MIMFGGIDDRGRLRNDVWAYDIIKDTFQEKKVRRGPKPSRRFRHSTIMRFNSLIVFGGNNGRRLLNDIWELNMDEMKWKKITVYGSAPRPRERHTANYSNNRMYIFGGYCGWHAGDLWYFDFGQSRWNQVWPKGLTRPSGRSSHASVIEGGIYVFGGVNHYTTLEDFWVFSIEERKWKEIEVTGPSPSPRHSLNMVTKGRFYIFGGFNGMLF